MVLPAPPLWQREVATPQPDVAEAGYGPKGVMPLTPWAPETGALRTLRTR